MVGPELPTGRLMIPAHSRRPSEWRRLFAVTIDLLDQVQEATAGYQLPGRSGAALR